MTAQQRDTDLRLLLLLEGRRIRRGGQMILLTQGLHDFVRLLDNVLREARVAGQLRSDLHLEGMRSALMGAFEGLMRGQLLAQRMGFPARFTAKDRPQML